MMALTHGFMSLAVAALVLPVVSEYVAPPLAVAAAVLGGLSPDLDVLAAHRRTLHYPVLAPLLAIACLAAFLVTGAPVALLVAVFVGAAGLHAVSDVLGGSAEPAPWDPVTEFGVYNHVTRHWHRPRRVVRYSGAPEDFLLGAGFAGVVLLSPATTPTMALVVVGFVVVAGGYSLSRRRLPAIRAALAAALPSRLRVVVPILRVEEHEGGGTQLVVRLNR